MSTIKDHMSYLVVCQGYLPERDTSGLDLRTTVQDIAAGQFASVVQVIEFNPIERMCRDVSEDIARLVGDVWAQSGEPLTVWQINFIEQFISVSVASSFRRAA